MCSNLPRVSVIIPTFNRANIVCRAINSVLSQTYSNIDCIVIDDGSTDNTYRILKDRYGSRIRVLRNEINREKSYSRNRGVKETDADYVCFLDSDDILTEDSVETRIECLLDRGKYDASFGLRLDESEEDKLINIDSYFKRLDAKAVLTLDQYLNDRKWLSTNSFLIHRETMLRYGMYNEELSNQEDVELFIRLLLKIKFYFCGTIVTKIFSDVDNRARNNFNKIIQQGTKLSKVLESNPDIVKGLGNRLWQLKGREYSEILSALYHSRRYSEFKDMFMSGVDTGLSPKNFKFYRRFVLSYLMSFLTR